MRRLQDRLLPAAVTVALAAFFGFGLLYPLADSFRAGLQDPAIKEALRKDETLAAFAQRTKIAEATLRELNGLPDGEPEPKSKLVLEPPHWNGRHLLGLFAYDAPAWRWLLNSLALAATVTLLCAGISYPLAYWQVRTRFRGQGLLGGLLLLPLILPPFVGAIGLRRVLGRFGTLNWALAHLGLADPADPIDFLGEHRMAGCVLVMVLHLYPLLYLNLAAAIANIDPSLIESARNLGSSPWRIFRRIVLPLSVPGLVAGGSLVFIGAFTDLGTPLVFSYREVVAQQIYSLANEQEANPAAPALVAIVTVVVLLLFAFTRWASRAPGGGGGKGAARTVERPLRGGAAALAIGFHLAVIGLAVIPHLSVFCSGLAERWMMTALPETWTLEHVREALSHPVAQMGIGNSLLYAAGSTAVDIVLGLACAWVIVRRGGAWGRLLDALTLAPLAIPGIVLAFGYVGVYAGIYQHADAVWPVGWFLVLSYAVRRLPYTTRACAAGLEQTPRYLEEAGGSLGAGPGTVLRKVTVPLIAANIAAGAILAFSFAMLEVSDSLILATRPGDFPLTKAIFFLFGRPGDGDQLASALGLFALFFLAFSLLSASAFLGRKWGEMFRG